MSVFDDPHVTLAHGNGGRFMRQLIDEIFARHLANPDLDVTQDAAEIAIDPEYTICTTTDGFIVQPLEFPGGDIGSLAVHGTVNDLAVSGAQPRYLTLNAIIEEGLEMKVLDRIVASLAAAAKSAGVRIVAGDTKVTPRGQGGGLYLATTGIGTRARGLRPAIDRIQPGDTLLLSGPIGDHGTAVMLARADFELKGDVRSDNASVVPLTTLLHDLDGLRFMRDPTRGGLATLCNEVARIGGFTVHLDEAAIPVRDPVRSVCDMLGYDPLTLACEGRVVAVVAAAQAEEALARWRAIPAGMAAAIIGDIRSGVPRVTLRTEIGGERLIEELEDDPLPRIC